MWFGLPHNIEILILEYDSTYREQYNKNIYFLDNTSMLHKQILLTYDNVYILDKLKFRGFFKEYYRFVLLRIQTQIKI